MNLARLSKVFPLIAGGFALALLVNWFAGDSYGQQAVPRASARRIAGAGTRMATGTYTKKGKLHVKLLNLQGREEYFETATSVNLQDEWALITLLEDEEEATVIYPRESIGFIKVWDVKEQER